MSRTITGVIREVDLGRRTVTLHDGTELWVPPEHTMGGLSGGLPIKAVWEDEGGRQRVREIRAHNVPP
jgi:Protein of unknown function (DUF1344)